MLRQDIITQAKLLIDETEGKPGYSQPFSWNYLVDYVADDLARSADAYFQSYSIDVSSGVAIYPQPTLYKVRAIVVTNSAGTATWTQQVRPQDMDLWQPGWRALPPASAPQYIVMQGINNLVLSPPPSYSVSAGILVEGYATPSNAGSAGANVWPNATDACPLPERAHMTVVYGVGAERCRQFPTPDNQARLATLVQRYNEMKMQLVVESIAANQAQRFNDGGSDTAYPAGQTGGRNMPAVQG